MQAHDKQMVLECPCNTSDSSMNSHSQKSQTWKEFLALHEIWPIPNPVLSTVSKQMALIFSRLFKFKVTQLASH